MVAGALAGVIVVALTANIEALMPVTYILIGLLAPVIPVTFGWMGSAIPGARGAAALALLGALAGGLIFPVAVGRLIDWTSPDALPPAVAAIAVADPVGEPQSAEADPHQGYRGREPREKCRLTRDVRSGPGATLAHKCSGASSLESAEMCRRSL